MTLEVREVHKSFGSIRAVADASFVVEPGEIVAVLGRNGAGKTTLLSIIAGQVEADGGSVRLDGEPIGTRSPAKARFGYAPQETGLYDLLTARENLRFFGELAGMRRAAIRSSIERLANAFELTHLLDRRVLPMSGGERRRIHTAAAIIGSPDVLLLDEPTVGADLEARRAILAAVKDLAASGVRIIYTTHYLPEVEQLDARVEIIHRGSIIATGTPSELVAEHSTEVVELQFAGAAPAPAHDHPYFSADGSTLTIRAPRAAELAARLMVRLGPDVARVVSIDARRASLDAVFTDLTKAYDDRTGVR